MLLPENAIGPDGFLPIKHNGKWYAVVISSKIYSNTIPIDVFDSSINSTDLSKVYYVNNESEDDGKPNKQYMNKREVFDHCFGKFQGVLRLHIHLPRVVNNSQIPNSDDSRVNIQITESNLPSMIEDKEAFDAVLEIVEPIAQ